MSREPDSRPSPSGESPAKDAPDRTGVGDPEHPAPPTASRLRQEIDHGRTGDKVDAADPSAVPLGTDDEAAGRAPSPSEVAAALDREQRSSRPQPAADPALGVQTWLLLAVLAVAAVIAVVAYYG